MNFTWRVKCTVTAYPNGCIYMQGTYRDAMGDVSIGNHLGLELGVLDAMHGAAEMAELYVQAARCDQLALDLRSIEEQRPAEGQ